MECHYFGECGSCRLYESGYEGQLAVKKRRFIELFGQEPEVFPSPPSHFRARAEFKIFHDESLSYAMHRVGGGYVKIEACPIVLRPIYDLMPTLLDAIKKEEILAKKLFRIDFLSGLSGEVLATLVYHRPIDETWRQKALQLAKDFGISIIGRSRGKKIVIGKEYIEEILPIRGREFTYLHYEGSFTQPNPYVNVKMIEWALGASRGFGGDLVELYCGGGNFTLPLAQNFEHVIATEISKASIKAAKEAAQRNSVQNVTFLRMSSEEFGQALRGKRQFRRLEGIDLKKYELKTLFVDPPRCGLDGATLEVAKSFENIIYISCNPETLHRDLGELTKHFSVEKLALFDQFPYTVHIECGVVLRR